LFSAGCPQEQRIVQAHLMCKSSLKVWRKPLVAQFFANLGSQSRSHFMSRAAFLSLLEITNSRKIKNPGGMVELQR